MLVVHQTHHFHLKACELSPAIFSLMPQFLNVVVHPAYQCDTSHAGI